MKKIFLLFLIFAILNLWGYDDFSIPNAENSYKRLSDLNQRELKLDNIITYQWNGAYWVNYMKEQLSYNVEGEISEIVTYTFNQNNWFKYYKQTFTYTQENELDEVMIYFWDSGSWNELYIYYYEFQNDQLTYLKRDIWNEYNDIFEDDLQQFYSYDGEALLHILSQTHNSEEWINQYINLMSYNEANQMEENLTKAWVVNDWVDDNRIIYTYEDIEQPSESTNQYMYLGEWINNTKNVNLYNSEEQIENQLTLIWDDDWTNNTNSSYQYDESGNLMEISQETWEEDWVQSLIFSYNYFEVAAETPEIEAAQFIEIYPNPCRINNSSKLHFNLRNLPESDLIIYNSKGQRIKTIAVNETKIYWDLKDKNGQKVSSGIYFAQQTSNGNIIGKHKFMLIK